MANEITYSSFANEEVAAVLSAEYLLLLADRNALPNHPALTYIGDVTGRGSQVIKQPFLGLMGYDVATSETEGTGPSNSALADAAASVTVAGYSKVYSATDLARVVDATGTISNPGVMAADALVTCV